MLLPEWILRDPSERSAGPPARVCENPAELFAHKRHHLLIGSCLRSRCLPSGSKSLFPPHFFHFDHHRVVAVTPSVLSENVASQTRRSPAPMRRCASRSASTTRTASPASTARRTSAGPDVEATQTAPSARWTLVQILRKTLLGTILSCESFRFVRMGHWGAPGSARRAATSTTTAPSSR